MKKSTMRGRYHFYPLIRKLRKTNTNEQIADLLDCSISSIKYVLRNFKEESSDFIPSKLDEVLGSIDKEFLRVSAVYKCMEVLSHRGWQPAESDPKCVYDVFALKGDRTIKIQVRSSSSLSGRGYPIFKTSRILFNTKSIRKSRFSKEDFDFWFFHSFNGDSWLIPFDKVTASTMVTMEGYDEYLVGGED